MTSIIKLTYRLSNSPFYIEGVTARDITVWVSNGKRAFCVCMFIKTLVKTTMIAGVPVFIHWTGLLISILLEYITRIYTIIFC